MNKQINEMLGIETSILDVKIGLEASCSKCGRGRIRVGDKRLDARETLSFIRALQDKGRYYRDLHK